MPSTKRVVLVLGAGASKPYGFPLGRDFLHTGQYLNANELDLVSGAGVEISQLEDFQRELLRSGVPSIDRFLEFQAAAGVNTFEKLGKAVIAVTLARNEDARSLHYPRRQDDNLDPPWYDYLLDRLAGASAPDTLLSESHISIVTFNYDRSFEFWILRALQSRFRWDIATALDCLRRLSVVHVHGSLGGSPSDGAVFREYGAVRSSVELDQCISSIRIVHEVDPSTPEWVKARSLLSMASHVVFLGFGFAKQNVDRLALGTYCRSRFTQRPEAAGILQGQGVPDSARLMGTRRGLTDSEMHDDVVGLLGIQLNEVDRFVACDVLTWLRNNVSLIKAERSD